MKTVLQLEKGIKRNIPLKSFVSFRIGGCADYFVEPTSEKELIAVLERCHQHKTPMFLLGSGTNLLIRDGGLRAVVVHLASVQASSQIKILSSSENEVVVRVPSFLLKAHLLEWALAHEYEGLEFSAGIPGSIGGGMFMNAGTRWGSYADIVDSLRLWSPGKNCFELQAKDLAFKYRGHGNQIFSDGAVVLSADLKLKKAKNISKSHSIVSMILSYRGDRQPLSFPNCGSVFKNPENSKMGAGRLIEACKLKGTRVGGAMISEQHANFILNVDQAKSTDVEDLIALMQREVRKQYQVDLEPEVIVCGSKKRLEEELLDLPKVF